MHIFTLIKAPSTKCLKMVLLTLTRNFCLRNLKLDFKIGRFRDFSFSVNIETDPKRPAKEVKTLNGSHERQKNEETKLIKQKGRSPSGSAAYKPTAVATDGATELEVQSITNSESRDDDRQATENRSHIERESHI